jgi:hypothetical protein
VGSEVETLEKLAPAAVVCVRVAICRRTVRDRPLPGVIKAAVLVWPPCALPSAAETSSNQSLPCSEHGQSAWVLSQTVASSRTLVEQLQAQFFFFQDRDRVCWRLILNRRIRLQKAGSLLLQSVTRVCLLNRNGGGVTERQVVACG